MYFIRTGKNDITARKRFSFVSRNLWCAAQAAQIGRGECHRGCASDVWRMFSGERTSYRHATEKVREIAENTPFSILGSTQIPFVARIISQLDQGRGLLLRFLFTFPKCLRPSPQATDQANALLEEDCPIKSTSDNFCWNGTAMC